MALKSIQPARRRLANEVYDQLIQAIMSGDIGPDDQLVQERLASELQISRTPVREALMRLEQEGVLTVSNRGTFRLYQMGDEEVKELYQSRAAIEGQVMRILTEHRNPRMIQSLRETIIEAENLKKHDVRSYFDANRTIHRHFVELAKNRFLLEMFDMLWGKAMAFHMFATIENVNLDKSLGDHMSLVDVIESGDKTAALEAITKHIQDGFDLQMDGIQAGRK